MATMAGNLGKFRENIEMFFVTGQTQTSMGSNVPTYSSTITAAHVMVLNTEQSMANGLDVLSENIHFETRVFREGRADKVEWRGNSYKVVSYVIDYFNLTVKGKATRRV